MNQSRRSPVCSIAFVAGALRSGSTLMRLMLDRHSRISNPKPGEFDFLFDAFGNDGGLAAAQALSSQQLDEFLSSHMIDRWLDVPIPPNGSTPERLREYVARHAERADCIALCAHRNFLSAHELFPEARFIHLLRDPRDCAKSSIAVGFAGNAYHGLDPWMQAEQSWDRLRPRLRPEQFVEVRYEELVAAPEAVLTRVCEFLGLAYEPGMLDLSGTTYEAPSPRFANQWRRTLSKRDVRLVEARAGQLMDARGYERASVGAGKIGAAMLLMLALQNKVAHHRGGIRAYGASLWLQQIIARRLGLQGWLHSVQSRMFPIKLRTLK
jgi:hypothetical protein